MFQAIATVIVAIIGLIGICIQTKSNTKIKSQEDLLTIVDEKIDLLKNQSESEDSKLHKRLDAMDMNNTKRFLIMEMTKIQNGNYIPNEEQKHVLHDTKKVYNDNGGDSYVDIMFERLEQKGLL